MIPVVAAVLMLAVLPDDLQRAGVALAAGDAESAIRLLEPLADADPAAGRLLAEAYLRSFRLEEGIALAERLAVALPDDTALRIAMADLLAEAGQLRAALALLDDATAATALAARAKLRYSLAEHASARADAEAALAAGEESPGLRALLGAILARLGELDAARAHLEAAIALRPGHAEAHFELGRLQLRARRVGDAIASFRSALEADRRHVGALFNLGNALVRAGSDDEGRRTLDAFRRRNAFAEREKDLRQTVLSNPGNVSALLELGRFLAERRRPREALPLLNRVVAMTPDPDPAPVLGARARVHRALGDGAAAVHDLEQALRVAGAEAPAAPELWLELAELHAASNNLARARFALGKCRDGTRGDDAVRWRLAAAEAAARAGGGWDQVSPHLRIAIEGQQTALEALLALVDVALAFERDADALKALADWSVAHPDLAEFDVARAVLQMERGRLDEAAVSLEKAHEKNPWLAAVEFYRAELARRAGDADAARVASRRARELDILANP